MSDTTKSSLKKSLPGLGITLCGVFLQRVDASFLLVGLIGISLTTWGIFDEIHGLLEARSVTRMMKMLIAVLASAGFASVGVAVVLYFTQTKPASAQLPSSKPAEGSPPVPAQGNSKNQSGGQTGGVINNNGPTYNGPVTVSPKERQSRDEPAKPKRSLMSGGSGGTVELIGGAAIGLDTLIDGGKDNHVRADGTIIRFGNDAVQLPPPDAEVGRLDRAALKARIINLAADLRASADHYRAREDEISTEFTHKADALHQKKLAGADISQAWAVARAEDAAARAANKAVEDRDLKAGKLHGARELTSAALIILGHFQLPPDAPRLAKYGGAAVSEGVVMGWRPSESIADFLDAVGAKL